MLQTCLIKKDSMARNRSRVGPIDEFLFIINFFCRKLTINLPLTTQNASALSILFGIEFSGQSLRIDRNFIKPRDHPSRVINL